MTRPSIPALSVLVLVLTACHRSAVVNTSATASAANTAAPALPAGVTAQLIAEGDSIFHAANASCGRCHAADATGGANAPSLKSGPWLHSDGSFDKIVATIVDGVPRDKVKDPTRRFAMNPRGGPMNLSDTQARAVAAYVWSISRAKTAGAT